MMIDLDAVHVSTGPNEDTIVTLYVRRTGTGTTGDGAVDAFEIIRTPGTVVSIFLESEGIRRVIEARQPAYTCRRKEP